MEIGVADDFLAPGCQISPDQLVYAVGVTNYAQLSIVGSTGERLSDDERAKTFAQQGDLQDTRFF